MPAECRLQNNFYRQPIAIELYHIIVRNCKLVERGQAEKKRFVLDLCFYKNITIGPTAWSNILWRARSRSPLSWTSRYMVSTIYRGKSRGGAGAVRQSAEDLQRCDITMAALSAIDAGAPAPAVRLPLEPSAYSARSCPFLQESGARLDLHARSATT